MNFGKGLPLLIGALAGLLSGLMGVGGGVVLVPMFTAFLNIPRHQAHGTSLATIIPIAAASSIPYILKGNIDWLLVVELALGSAVGAAVGAQLMTRIPARRLRQAFGAFLIITAALILWNSFAGRGII